MVQSDNGAIIGECTTSVGKLLRVKGRVRVCQPTTICDVSPAPKHGRGMRVCVELQAEISLRRPRLVSGDLGSAVGVVGVSGVGCGAAGPVVSPHIAEYGNPCVVQVSAQVVINGPTVFHGDVDARRAAEVNPETFQQWRATLPMAQRMHMVRCAGTGGRRHDRD